MHLRSFAIFWSAVACMLLATTAHSANQKVWRIGIVLDGPWAREQHLIQMLQDEITGLTSGEFDVRFPEQKVLHGNWTLKGVNRAIDQQLRDPQVDLVIALGTVSSSEVARRKGLPKPVMAPVIVGMQSDLPYREGVSGVHNLNYLASFQRAPSNVLLLHELHPFKRIAIVIDPLIESVIDRFELDKLFRQIPSEQRFIVPAHGSPEETVARIPADADAVMVLALLRYSREEIKQFADLLIERRLPSLSILGGYEIEAGMLAATSAEQDLQRLGRRIALNIQRIMLGENPADIGVDFKQAVRPVINVDTARKIGLSPSFDLLNSSRLYGDLEGKDARTLHLIDAVEMAVKHNLSLEVSQRGLRSGAEDVVSARSNLRPQFEASLQGREIDEDRAEASGAVAAHYESSASLTMRQLLYSEPARSNVRIQKLLQEAREVEHETAVLDIVLDTSVGYLNLLRSDALARIRKEDLALTRSNLERARTRVDLGAANRSEELRWESEIAKAQSQLVNANVGVSQARVGLSQLVNQPLESRYKPLHLSLGDPNFLISNPRLLRYIGSPASVKILRDFLVQEGVRNAPELRQLELAISAQGKAASSARKAFTHPEVGLAGELTEILARGGAGATDPPFGPAQDNTNWHIGFSAKLPLYSGGARSSEVRRAVNEVARLQQRRDEAMQGIEAGIRARTYSAGGAYRNIQWARQRKEAAGSTLDLVSDAYSRGAVDIIDLLDAQTSAVNADSAAANAVYDFLVEFMGLQRAMGAFDFLMTPEQRLAWHQRMDDFFAARDFSVSEVR